MKNTDCQHVQLNANKAAFARSRRALLMIRNYLRKAADNTLARNAGWLFAGQGLSFFVQAAYFVVLARLLGSAQYGILAAAFALVSMFSQYSAMGSGLLFLRYVSPDHSRFREVSGKHSDVGDFASG